MPDIVLGGCRTRPLLPYLKALGIFRTVGSHDPSARLWWSDDGTAVLRSCLDEEGLIAFFLADFSPSSITSPWNGGSGYFEGDNVDAITMIERSDSPRLAPLRETVTAARAALSEVLACSSPVPKALKETMKGDVKRAFLEKWRATTTERSLAWLDTAIGLGTEGPAMNPLLGSGGNDGRFEFSNNYLARLCDCLPELLDGKDSRARSATWLRQALLEDGAVPLASAAIGMFDPASAGLPNSSSSGTEDSLVNPWDFVLMLEGALLFSGGVARTLTSDRVSFPFTMRTASLVGPSLESGSDAETRGETWLPVWQRPASLAVLRRLFAEGRVQDGRQSAWSGRSAIRAVATFGVDRGLTSFERVVYSQRFGRTFVAVPVGRLQVRQVRELDLTRAADRWLARVRRLESNAVSSGVAAVERAELQLATGADASAALERWLLALADLELLIARIPSARDRSKPASVPPLAGLPVELLTTLPDCVELRLATACASIGRRVGEVGLRSLVEPVETTAWGGYAWAADIRRTTPLAHPIQFLAEFAMSACAASSGTPPAAVGDVAAFLDGPIDDRRLVRLAHALTLCSPGPAPRAPVEHRGAHDSIDRLFALATLVASGGTARRPGGIDRPITRSPEVVELLAGGRARDAARVAWRRLQSSELAPVRGLESLDRTIAESQRIAAALCFPLSRGDRDALSRLVLRPERPNEPLDATATIPPEEPIDD